MFSRVADAFQYVSGDVRGPALTAAETEPRGLSEAAVFHHRAAEPPPPLVELPPIPRGRMRVAEDRGVGGEVAGKEKAQPPDGDDPDDKLTGVVATEGEEGVE